MNKKDDEIAHPGMLSKPEKHLILAQFTNSPWTGLHHEYWLETAA
jgi:hypothetical protein